MQLEQTLQMYEVRREEVDRANSSSGLYELLSGNCGGKVGPISFGIGGMGTEGGPLKSYRTVESTERAEIARHVARRDLGLVGTGSSFKIFEGSGAPLARYDIKHHEFGDSHLQYGENLFTNRKGNEAADIFAELLRNNPNIKFPGQK